MMYMVYMMVYMMYMMCVLCVLSHSNLHFSLFLTFTPLTPIHLPYTNTHIPTQHTTKQTTKTQNNPPQNTGSAPTAPILLALRQTVDVRLEGVGVDEKIFALAASQKVRASSFGLYIGGCGVAWVVMYVCVWWRE